MCPSHLVMCGEFLGKDLLTILLKDSGHSWEKVPFGPRMNAFAKSKHSCKPLFDFATPLSMERESELEIAFEQFHKDKMHFQDNGLSAIRHEEVKTLKGSNWLNDSVINLCFDALQVRDKLRTSELFEDRTIVTKNCFMKTYFAQLLLSGVHEHQSLMDASRKHDIFNQDRLFFPVNVDNNHWVLVVVFVQERIITVFDSLHDKNKLHGEPRKHENLLLLFFHFLCNEHRSRTNGMPLEGEWTLHAQPPRWTPTQNNGDDCGVYICMFADLLSLGCVLDFQPDQAVNYRKMLALNIFNNTVTENYNPQRLSLIHI